MARTQGTNARTQRLIALVATCLLAATTAFAIGRVFVGHGSTYRLVAAGLLSAVIACALERRNLLLATLVSAAAMIAVVGLLVFPGTTWHGLPTLETIRSMVEAAGLVGEQARIQVAPTEPLGPLLLAAITATWAAVFSAHALAFRAGSPLLALLPPIALVAFADTVLEELVRPLYGVAFLIAAAAVIFADGLRRVQGWGPVWSGPGRQARLSVSAGKGARRVTAAAVALAAISPLILPGFGSQALLDFSSKTEDTIRIDPLVSVKSSLTQDEEAPVFEVSTQEPSYWRMVALPNFDGTTWRPDLDAGTIEAGPDIALAPNAAADPAVTSASEPISVSFHVSRDLALPWLPLPYPAASTDLDADGLRYDPEAGSLSLQNTVDMGTSYTATVQLVRPSPDELRAEDTTPSEENLRYIQFPDDLPERIHALAQDWTAGTDTTYDAVIAVQQEFTTTGGFVYSTDVPGRDDNDALLRFLQDKKGFCQQFASAMAIMLRSLGIPARVAMGFTAGQFDDSADLLQVTTKDAHAWVEVLFPDYGWLTFDPTPGIGDSGGVVAYPYMDPTSGSTCQANRGGDCGGTPNRTGANGLDGQGGRGEIPGGLRKEQVRPSPVPNSFQGVGAIGALPPTDSGITARQWLLIGLGVLLIGLALVPPVRGLRRRRRLRRAAAEPRGLILATYDVFTERAAELGFPRDHGQTLDEYRAHVTGSGQLDGAGDDLERLTTIAVGAAYSRGEPGGTEAREATRAADTAIRALRRNAGLARRLGGMYLRR